MSSNESNDRECGSRLVADWTRPAGPLNVWRTIECVEKLTDGTTMPVRLSIQEIPQSTYRYDEVVQHMCDYFIAEEVMCKALNLKDDEDAVNDFRSLWNYLVRKNMSVGAYKLDSKNEILELVAVNILLVETQEIEKAIENFIVTFKSNKARTIFEFVHRVAEKADILKLCGVDKYLSALGLSVVPAFRGQKLGVKLLEARDDIGKKYKIEVSSTMFTGPASQKQAERAGYKTVHSQEYAEYTDADNKPLFPNIQAKMTKIMMKELC